MKLKKKKLTYKRLKKQNRWEIKRMGIKFEIKTK